MNETIMAKRILKKQCPYCAESDITINWITRKAKCNSCGKSMRKEEGEKILRRADIPL